MRGVGCLVVGVVGGGVHGGVGGLVGDGERKGGGGGGRWGSWGGRWCINSGEMIVKESSRCSGGAGWVWAWR